MIYFLPYTILSMRLPIIRCRRNFSCFKIDSGITVFNSQIKSYDIRKYLHCSLYRTSLYSTHKDLLKVLETYKQSLEGDMCTKFEKDKDCNLESFHLDNHQLCNSDTVNAFQSSSTSFQQVSSHTEDTSSLSGRQNFIASYDPKSLNENLYSLTLNDVDSKLTSEPKDSSEDLNKMNEAKRNLRKNSLKSEDTERNEKKKYFSRSLSSYIQVCWSSGLINHAHNSFLYYHYKNKTSKKYNGSIDINVYNTLLNSWSQLGNLMKIKEVFSYMKEDEIEPDLQSYAAYLECLSRSENIYSTSVKEEVAQISKLLQKKGSKFDDILHGCRFSGDQLIKIIEILQSTNHTIPNPEPYACHTSYECNLLKDLDDTSCVPSPYVSSAIPKEDIEIFTSTQMQMETEYFFKVKAVNIGNDIDEKTLFMRNCVQEHEETFRKDLLNALDIKISNVWNDVKGQKRMNLYPYLVVVNKETLVTLLLQEIRNLAETAEYFSPNIRILCTLMGNKVMNYYFICQKQQNKVTDKVSLIHSKFVEYLLSGDLSSSYKPREYWEFLKRLYFRGPTIDVADSPWPHHVLFEVGKFLYDILLEDASFDVNRLRKRAKKKLMVRPFYTMYERCKDLPASQIKGRTSLQIRAHPKLCKLYHEAKLEHIEFDVTMIPMVCPPRPWTKIDAGGLLMTSVPFIRLPAYATQHNTFYDNIPNQTLHPCFDSLNNLSLCSWIINQPVLDAIIDVFRNGGSEELDVPLDPETLGELPKVNSTMTDEEKKKLRREKACLKKLKQETTSLWFDCLYKLSIANHFRDKIFWFPHNLDFRGRVYPTPPHFNHLGSDMVRSILLFAEGKPLGKNGLNWLKIHLVNLTGFKKRDPNRDRLKFANEVMDEILDSADNPFTGRQWWKTSDEPWQTLACCKEVAKAVRSPNPEEYISHFPVHQDGSCNGLQHYAALGRDMLGAKEVNLYPASCPQDVYTGVANLVEEERKKNAAEGHEIAQALEGFVKRKVVKQTIMTFVYGVTEYGAKHQILKQLKASNFSEDIANLAARYLMKLTFASIQKMFTATREIQKWFTDSAELITQLSGEPVEWITPLGLPVIQPYHRKATVRSLSEFVKGKVRFGTDYDASASSYESTREVYQLPNVRKQKNAFAPNFIHSLDSSHMMLTSLFSQRQGITFVSVHDCYWTHPINVEVMNKVCREQFVSLHSQPILENLSKFFLQKFTGENFRQASEYKEKRLKTVLTRVPKKGSFNLKYVLDSVYFFS